MNRFHLMIWKEFAHIRADKLSMRLMVGPVFVMLFVLGYALTTEVKNVNIGIVDRSRTPQSRELVETIRSNAIFRWQGYVGTEGQAKAAIDRGDIKTALLIPPDFSSDLSAPGGAVVQLLVDGQDANSANVARGYLVSIVSKWGMDRFRRSLEARGVRVESVIPVRTEPVILFNPSLESTWYMVPALAVLLVTIITGLLSGLSIVKEKEAGTLEQLMVTPVDPQHVIVGKSVPYLIIGLAEICLFLLLATLWFGIPFLGSFPVLLVFGFVYMISSLGIGILTSTVAKTPQQVLFLVWFVLIFFILLSGFFMPVENMPSWVQGITAVNPVKYFMFAVREMSLKGSGMAELWRELAAMLVIGTVVFGAAVLLFHRRAK